MADEIWDGVLVRCSNGETGTVPRSTPASSPDLICNGTTPMGDPAMLEDEANYGNSFANQIYEKQYNYLYVRAKNMHNGPVKGHFELYYSEARLLLYPGEWKKNQLATSNGDKEVPFELNAQNEIAATIDPFKWLVETPSTGQHYCIIGCAPTDLHPDPVPDTYKISDWGAWLAQNGNIAQRNTALITGNIPEFTDTFIYDQGEEASKVDLTFLCYNIPKGSKIMVSSGKPLHGEPISWEIDSTTDYDFKYGIPDLEIDANWWAEFTCMVWFGSDWGDITGAPKVTVRGEIPLESDHKYYHLGKPASPHPVTGKPRVDKLGKPVRILTVGSYSMVCPDKINPKHL